MNDNCGNEFKNCIGIEKQSTILYLGQQWAKKYLQTIEVHSFKKNKHDSLNFKEVVSPEGREKTVGKLIASLRTVSLQAWNKTEALLTDEVKRHHIDPKLINPWEITADAFNIYEQVLHLYGQQVPSQYLSPVMIPERQLEPRSRTVLEMGTEQAASTQLAMAISASVGALRKKYTQNDFRVIAFVSTQFHYTGLGLLQTLSQQEQTVLSSYLKVIDDHLHMPLQRAYEAAAEHDYNSTALAAVQQLLPISTQIAKKICKRIIELYPNYLCLSGLLSDPLIKFSSIRDVEMFQVYLWVCTLEGSIRAIQQELFPICVMLYPRLQVQWELIRCMLHLLEQEISQYLTDEQANTLMPYLQVLWHMFSPKVFGELVLET